MSTSTVGCLVNVVNPTVNPVQLIHSVLYQYELLDVHLMHESRHIELCRPARFLNLSRGDTKGDTPLYHVHLSSSMGQNTSQWLT